MAPLLGSGNLLVNNDSLILPPVQRSQKRKAAPH